MATCFLDDCFLDDEAIALGDVVISHPRPAEGSEEGPSRCQNQIHRHQHESSQNQTAEGGRGNKAYGHTTTSHQRSPRDSTAFVASRRVRKMTGHRDGRSAVSSSPRPGNCKPVGSAGRNKTARNILTGTGRWSLEPRPPSLHTQIKRKKKTTARG